MTFESSYRRAVREAGVVHAVRVRRAACRPCRASHALLPDFVVHRRRDSVEAIGDALAAGAGKLRLDRVGLHAMQQEPDFPVRALRGRVEQVAQANVDEQPDDEVAPEVPTSFATKGLGWSGREEDDLEVIELGRPPCPSDVAERSRVQGEEPPENKSGPGSIGFRLARR